MPRLVNEWGHLKNLLSRPVISCFMTRSDFFGLFDAKVGVCSELMTTVFFVFLKKMSNLPLSRDGVSSRGKLDAPFESSILVGGYELSAKILSWPWVKLQAVK